MTTTAITAVDLTTDFRHAMGKIASAVSVVTTFDGDEPVGTTVSAFCSLSLDPPMALVSLDRRSSLLALLRPGSPLGLNVLAAHHDQVALRFAQKGVDRFADLPWRESHGAPELGDKAAWVAMRVASLVPAGDHVLVLGDVLAADTYPHAPLVYYQRAFGTHQSF